MHRVPALRPDGLARDGARGEAEASAPAPPTRLLALQRSTGNSAVARLLAGEARPRGPRLQRFEEQEHKAIGDAAVGDVAFRISPLVQLTYGDIVALGDYFHGVREIEGLIKQPGSGKGTIGEIYYAVWVKVRGEDEKKYMGEFFDASAKEAVVARFYKLAGSNIGHFPNPEEGDPARPPQDKDRRHDKDGAPVGAIATYRDTHVQAITRAVELGAAGRPITEALVFEAFGDHFLTDAFSAGHVRTPRKSVREYWDAKVPGFAERLERWMAEQVSTHLDHAGNQPEQVAPHGFKRTKALEGIKKALAVAGSITFGDLVSGAVHDYDSQRGVVADIDGERVRLVGDGGLFAKDPSTGQWSTPSKAKDTMQAATRAVKAGVDEVEKAYSYGQSGQKAAAVLGALSAREGKLFAAETLLPTPVPDDQLSEQDKSLQWEVETPEKLFEDHAVRVALVVFANNKASTIGDLLDDPEIPEHARDALSIRLVNRLSSTDTNTIVALLKEILAYN